MPNLRVKKNGTYYCKRCKIWRQKKYFYYRDGKYLSTDCIRCTNKRETENYIEKSKDDLFMQMERARRKERYWRQQYLKFKKLYDGTKLSNDN